MVKPPNSGQRYYISMLGFNALEFSPDPPGEMGLGPKGVVPTLRVVEGSGQYFKQRHEHSFHAYNACGRVPERARKSVCTEFLVGAGHQDTELSRYRR